jgi:hypothetical protein
VNVRSRAAGEAFEPPVDPFVRQFASLAIAVPWFQQVTEVCGVSINAPTAKGCDATAGDDCPAGHIASRTRIAVNQRAAHAQRRRVESIARAAHGAESFRRKP